MVLGDMPQGTKTEDAAPHVRLLMLVNDVSLRNLIPDELAKGFGFFQGKPASAFSPFAVTPDELGAAGARGGCTCGCAARSTASVVGDTDAGPEMHFSFFDLVQHIARTRGYTAGTILGIGHGVQRGARAGHLVPRRGADDRDHRAGGGRRRPS